MNLWTEKQKQGFAFFNENLDIWADDPAYRLKYAIITGRELKGTYDTFGAALGNAAATYRKGEYIIQKIVPEDEPIDTFSAVMMSA